MKSNLALYTIVLLSCCRLGATDTYSDIKTFPNKVIALRSDGAQVTASYSSPQNLYFMEIVLPQSDKTQFIFGSDAQKLYHRLKETKQIER